MLDAALDLRLTPTMARRAHAASGGNPFYVTEVLASAHETVPPTVRDAVLARAARLSDAASAVLAAAAVIGSHPEIDVLAAVADQPLAALDECLAAGMLVDGGTHVTFRHELAREAVVETLTAARAVIAGPELRETLANLTALTAELRDLPARLEARSGPLLTSAVAVTDQAGLAASDARWTIGTLDATFGSRSTF